MKKAVLPVLMATVWISISEFVRNTFLLHDDWVRHYTQMNLTFPEENINGALWGVWSFGFAIVIYVISRKFSLIETTLLAWAIGFLLMWLVIGNLGVLPLAILPWAVPLSLLEAFLASFIVKKLGGVPEQ